MVTVCLNKLTANLLRGLLFCIVFSLAGKGTSTERAISFITVAAGWLSATLYLIYSGGMA